MSCLPIQHEEVIEVQIHHQLGNKLMIQVPQIKEK